MGRIKKKKHKYVECDTDKESGNVHLHVLTGQGSWSPHHNCKEAKITSSVITWSLDSFPPHSAKFAVKTAWPPRYCTTYPMRRRKVGFKGRRASLLLLSCVGSCGLPLEIRAEWTTESGVRTERVRAMLQCQLERMLHFVSFELKNEKKWWIGPHLNFPILLLHTRAETTDYDHRNSTKHWLNFPVLSISKPHLYLTVGHARWNSTLTLFRLVGFFSFGCSDCGRLQI